MAGNTDASAGEGRWLRRAAWVGTAVFAVASVLVLVVPASWPVVAVVDVALCVLGVLAFGAAYLGAVARSREEAIGMGGLFFLAGDTAPAAVRRSLVGAFALQVVIAFASAGIGLSLSSDEATNPAAFGILVPMYGLGLCGLWGARWGRFGPRAAPGAGTPGAGTPDDGTAGAGG